jgi:hypothetical protein
VAVELLSLFAGGAEARLHLRLATIPGTYTSGRPTVIFDGEGTASTRTYLYLSSYVPAAGDRVLVAMVGRSGIILGKPV